MPQTTREANAFEEFQAVFAKAQALLPLREIVEKRKGVVAVLGKLPRFPDLLHLLRKLPQPDELKDKFIKWADTVHVSLCDSLVVLAVSALEVYLREAYRGATHEPWKGKALQSTESLTEWAKLLKEKSKFDLRPFGEISEEALHEAFEYRHVIIHSGGTVDDRAKLPGVKKGEKTRDLLTLKKTRGLLASIEKCAKSIHTQFISQGQR